MEHLKLFMILLGCKAMGRHTEQHDIYFGIGSSLKDTVPGILQFWPDGGSIHIDAWREVTEVDGYNIQVMLKEHSKTADKLCNKLFFLNLGGYKPLEFEEYHYKMLAIGNNKEEVIKQAKQTAFYKHTGFKGAESHIDDKYGVDVDDLYDVEDILPLQLKENYTLKITALTNSPGDEWHLGYTILSRLMDQPIQ
jgi:hypothetical protein